MKTLLLILSSILLSVSIAFAQKFSVPKDTIFESVYDSKTMYNNISNDSDTALKITWKVINHDFPASWGANFAICDNMNCYYNLNNSLLDGTPYESAPIPAKTKGNFYVLLDLSAAENGKHFVTIQMSGGDTIVNATWVITRMSTGLSLIEASSKNIVVYPVPGKNVMSFTYNESKPLSVVIYNSVGSEVLRNKDSKPGTPINIEHLGKGMYFVKLEGEDWFSYKSLIKE